jgi:hypothetical protein
VDNQRARSPCGLIASARGWPVVEIWSNKCLWLGGSSFVCNQLDYIYKQISVLCCVYYDYFVV